MADWLANAALKTTRGMTLLEQSPVGIGHFLAADALGVLASATFILISFLG